MFGSPNAKAYTAGVIPAAIYIFSWAALKFWNVEIPEEVQLAAAVVLGPIGVWLVPNA